LMQDIALDEIFSRAFELCCSEVQLLYHIFFLFYQAEISPFCTYSRKPDRAAG
jgi:hypothetical protein